MELMDILNAIDLRHAIFFEDDFICKNKEAIFFDLIKLSISERKYFLKCLESPIKETIAGIIERIKDIAVKPTDPQHELFRLLKANGFEEIIEDINQIDEDVMDSITPQLMRFGLGVACPGQYQQFFQSLPFNCHKRIYNDFTSLEEKYFNEDLEKSKQSVKLIIIDDDLHDTPRARDIIEKTKRKSSNVAAIVFSSKSNMSTLHEYDKDLGVEYVKKGEENTYIKIKEALIKSAFNMLVRNLKKLKIDSIQAAFDKYFFNSEFIGMLNQQAISESLSAYFFIKDWLNVSLEHCDAEKANIENIKKIMRLSTIFESDEFYLKDEEIKHYENFQNFDNTINTYLIPPNTGDIFKINEKYFVLVGQDCDYSIRPKLKRKNSFFEFVPIILDETKRNQTLNEEYILSIDNFKINDKYQSINIDCGNKFIIRREIVDLCAFNINGLSKIDLKSQLPDEYKFILPKNWVEYFEYLKEYFGLVKKSHKQIAQLNQNIFIRCEEEFIKLDDFTYKKNNIVYEIGRICRIKDKNKYLINKLYFEHKGRQAYNNIHFKKKLIPTEVHYNGKQFCIDINMIFSRDSDDILKAHWRLSNEKLSEIGIPIFQDIIIKKSLFMNRPYTFLKKELDGKIVLEITKN